MLVTGTLGRLILGLLIHTKNKIKIIGDQSLSKRDFNRIINPLKKFGAKFNSKQGGANYHNRDRVSDAHKVQ